MSTTLFGEQRQLLGYESQEWAVWVSGTDDIHDRNTLGAALHLAAELNAGFAQMRFNSNSEYDPVMYAVVLHYGYAWAVDTEHALGLDCGVPACGEHEAQRAAKAAGR
ncbi:hypothetical protein [Streptomyces sp. DT18]